MYIIIKIFYAIKQGNYMSPHHTHYIWFVNFGYHHDHVRLKFEQCNSRKLAETE